MPKELVAVDIGKLEWKEYAEPDLLPGQVRVKSVCSAAKHGTESVFFLGKAVKRGAWNGDLQIFEPADSSTGLPAPVGNMFVGEVTETADDVKSLKAGDTVYSWGGFRDTHVVSESGCRKFPN